MSRARSQYLRYTATYLKYDVSSVVEVSLWLRMRWYSWIKQLSSNENNPASNPSSRTMVVLCIHYLLHFILQAHPLEKCIGVKTCDQFYHNMSFATNYLFDLKASASSRCTSRYCFKYCNAQNSFQLNQKEET